MAINPSGDYYRSQETRHFLLGMFASMLAGVLLIFIQRYYNSDNTNQGGDPVL